MLVLHGRSTAALQVFTGGAPTIIANTHGWPGWKMEKVTDGEVPNLYSSLAAKSAENIIFSNFIDGGMDTS